MSENRVIPVDQIESIIFLILIVCQGILYSSYQMMISMREVGRSGCQTFCVFCASLRLRKSGRAYE